MSNGPILQGKNIEELVDVPSVRADPRRLVWDCVADLLDDGIIDQRSVLLDETLLQVAGVFILESTGEVRLDGKVDLRNLNGNEFAAVPGRGFPYPSMIIHAGSVSWVDGLILTGDPTDLSFPGLGNPLKVQAQVESVFVINDDEISTDNVFATGARVDDLVGLRYGEGLWRVGGSPQTRFGRVEFPDGGIPSLGGPRGNVTNRPLTDVRTRSMVAFFSEDPDAGSFDAALGTGATHPVNGAASAGVLKDELSAADQPGDRVAAWLYRVGTSFSVKVLSLRVRGSDGV